MEQSFVVDGKKFTLSGVSGTVLSEMRTSTTHVSGSVSEAPIIGVYGSVKSHTTAVDQEIWIRRDDDGNDFVIRFPKDIPLLGGQRITVVGLSHNQSLQWVFFRNESASTNYLFMSSYGFVYDFFRNSFGVFGLIVLAAAALLVFMFTNGGPVSIVPAALFVLIVVSGAKKKSRRRALYKDALQRMLNDLGVDYAVQ